MPILARDDFVNALKIMREAWCATQMSLQSYGGISGAIAVLANIIYFLIEFIVVLAIYNVNFYSIYLPISTTLISLSFVVGTATQRQIDNLLFVLVSCPFENGAMTYSERQQRPLLLIAESCIHS